MAATVRAKRSEQPHTDPESPLTNGHPAGRAVLIVEDDEKQRRQLHHLIAADAHLCVESTGDGKQALERIGRNHYSVVVTDLRLPGLDGMDLIREAQRRRLPVSIIVTTGEGSVEEAVEALHLGAVDFLVKPVDVDHLRHTVRRALRERRLFDEVSSLRHQLQARYAFHNVLSKNPQMHAIFELIANMADSAPTVLIEGETGTGKEQVARAVHEASSRAGKPMIAVNCAALPEGLLESELFGHEKGAFTNAVGMRQGRFELAHGGTLLLDEVGDIPAAMQAKLLRVLQERRFERVGGTQTLEVDVRVIAATNRPLARLVRKGQFREDLFYRLNVVKLDLPPLRERPEDIPLLAGHFVEKYTRPGEKPRPVSPRAMEILLNHHWPGNIRQLENAIERACVTMRGDTIEPENLPPDLLLAPALRAATHVKLDRPLPQVVREMVAGVEEQYIRKALQKTQGNVSRCARLCGLSRRSMTAKMVEYKLDKSAFKYP